MDDARTAADPTVRGWAATRSCSTRQRASLPLQVAGHDLGHHRALPRRSGSFGGSTCPIWWLAFPPLLQSDLEREHRADTVVLPRCSCVGGSATRGRTSRSDQALRRGPARSVVRPKTLVGRRDRARSCDVCPSCPGEHVPADGLGVSGHMHRHGVERRVPRGFPILAPADARRAVDPATSAAPSGSRVPAAVARDASSTTCAMASARCRRGWPILAPRECSRSRLVPAALAVPVAVVVAGGVTRTVVAEGRSALATQGRSPGSGAGSPRGVAVGRWESSAARPAATDSDRDAPSSRPTRRRPGAPSTGSSSPIAGVGGTAASRLSVKTIPKPIASARTGARRAAASGR